ncbi:hypothetical protein ISCGN_025898 [Ixodes scapularis]
MLSSIISSTDCWLAVEYASSSWPGFRELVEAGVGKALPRPEERADDEGVRSSSLEEVVCDGPSLRTEGGARGTTPDAFGGDTSFGAMVSIASFKRGAAAPFRHREPFGSNDKRGRGADLGGAGGVGGAARSLGQTWVPTEVFGDTPPGPNLPRAQLNHQDALFPGHGLATHSQTWVGLSHFYSGSVVSPKWLGSVVTLLTKHLAPKVQAPPAELGVRGAATLQTPAFTDSLDTAKATRMISAAFYACKDVVIKLNVRPSIIKCTAVCEENLEEMNDNAALANEFELPFSDLTPTEREMLVRTQNSGETIEYGGAKPDTTLYVIFGVVSIAVIVVTVLLVVFIMGKSGKSGKAEGASSSVQEHLDAPTLTYTLKERE